MSQPQNYVEFEQEYNRILSRIRSFLASTRSIATLNECQRLITEAKRCAHAMLGLAEIEGNFENVEKSKQRLAQEIEPLSQEINMSLEAKKAGVMSSSRQELFSKAARERQGSDVQRLLADTDSMLRESQALCFESEQITSTTLEQMGRQRSQLENANSYLDQTIGVTSQARDILTQMSNRALRNKMFLYFLIGFLLLANCFALYRIFNK